MMTLMTRQNVGVKMSSKDAGNNVHRRISPKM